ncbi:hypothetical protein [Streptodolium elevatio]
MVSKVGLVRAVARELRMRRFMGPLPFDLDQWMRQAPESDLPRPRREGGGRVYHFEVGAVDGYTSVSFALGCSSNRTPYLFFSGGHRFATVEEWRALVTHINRFAERSVFLPRRYVWLRGYRHLARRADDEYCINLYETIKKADPEHTRGTPLSSRPGMAQLAARAETARRRHRR